MKVQAQVQVQSENTQKWQSMQGVVNFGKKTRFGQHHQPQEGFLLEVETKNQSQGPQLDIDVECRPRVIRARDRIAFQSILNLFLYLIKREKGYEASMNHSLTILAEWR